MLERSIERLLFACRWLLAPVYLGLSLALVVLAVKFFQEAWHVISQVVTLAEADLVLTLLAMIDLVLVGSLIVMVMFSGYENFVSRIDLDTAGDTPAWLWYVVLHLTFVVSAVLLGVLDRMAFAGHRKA